MSLDISLYDKQSESKGSGIYIRESGQNRQISRAEWDERFPGEEPVLCISDSKPAFECNVTHNLVKMAEEAGLYKAIWQPDKNGFVVASQLIQPLWEGLLELLDNPAYFKRFESSNGWGTYPLFVRFVALYLYACETYPNASISVSR